MVSSPKDQEQGNHTEKQAHPIPVYDQLDYRRKQQTAHQEHNAVHLRTGINASATHLVLQGTDH